MRKGRKRERERERESLRCEGQESRAIGRCSLLVLLPLRSSSCSERRTRRDSQRSALFGSAPTRCSALQRARPLLRVAAQRVVSQRSASCSSGDGARRGDGGCGRRGGACSRKPSRRAGSAGANAVALLNSSRLVCVEGGRARNRTRWTRARRARRPRRGRAATQSGQRPHKRSARSARRSTRRSSSKSSRPSPPCRWPYAPQPRPRSARPSLAKICRARLTESAVLPFFSSGRNRVRASGGGPEQPRLCRVCARL